jgi:tetratricopeptide (TPR) repeat protein
MKPSRNDPCPCGSGKKYKHCCERKSESRPIFSASESSQLQLLLNAKKYAEIEAKAAVLLERFPDEPAIWKPLAISLQMQGKAALAAFRKAAELLPNDVGAHTNLGNALYQDGRLKEAESSFLYALKLSGNFAHAHYGLASVLYELGQLEKAIAGYRRTLALNPDFIEAHYNLGHALLGMGQYAEGWKEYEYRLMDPELQHIRTASRLPQWRGQTPSPDDRLLVFGEQGFGDTLQFGRYLLLVAEKFPGGISVVVGSPLYKLFGRSFPNVEVLDSIPVDQRAWRCQCPLLSLPLAFNTTVASIPKPIPYLVPDPARVSHWKDRIAALALPSSTCKIGVVWKAGALMKIASQKSLPFQLIAPLLNRSGCAWFSLQKEPDPDSSTCVASGKLIDWSADFGSFDETAALVANLDLVISVDTSVAHLAGGLGLSVWLLNRQASDWRWMRERADSPWYPTMQIFNQKTPGDWSEVVRQMTVELGRKTGG